MTTVLVLLAAATLGVMVGALLAEALILVPLWRSMAPSVFFAWYREHGGLLLRFFGPLEVAAASSAVLAAAAAWIRDGHVPTHSLAAASLCVVVLAMFPLYFQAANARFAAASIEPDQLAERLRDWARWHWLRVGVSAAAFGAALLAL